jgi:MFS family permease
VFVPLGYVSLYALHRGYGEAFSFQILTVLNSASVVGRVLPGFYADKIGVFNVNILGVVLSSVACLALWLPAGGTTPGLVVFSILFGFASGGNISLIPVCIGKLCPTNQYGRY